MSDIFHTFFGISGLSLLGYFDGKNEYAQYEQIDPTYALPVSKIKKLELTPQCLEELEVPDLSDIA